MRPRATHLLSHATSGFVAGVVVAVVQEWRCKYRIAALEEAPQQEYARACREVVPAVTDIWCRSQPRRRDWVNMIWGAR